MPKAFRATRADLDGFRGKRIHGALFSVSYALCPTGPKAAVAISKKIVRTAAGRNRLKRRARSILLKAFQAHTPALLLLFQAKTGAGTASFEAVERDIISLLSQIRI